MAQTMHCLLCDAAIDSTGDVLLRARDVDHVVIGSPDAGGGVIAATDWAPICTTCVFSRFGPEIGPRITGRRRDRHEAREAVRVDA